MKTITLYLIFFLTICFSANAQMDILTINPNIVMLEDSLENEALLVSVEGFLITAQKNTPNEWVLTTEGLETQILIDEIEGIQKSKKFKNDAFFKPYLTNIIPLEEHKYTIKIAYIGMNKNTPIVRANLELIAHKTNDRYLISSPLSRNSQNWKTKKIQNHIFHYPYSIDNENVQKFTERVILYDKKLKNNEREFHYYLCKEETAPLQLFGVEYKSDYNGEDLYNRWLSDKDDKTLWVLSEDIVYTYDTHDLWHNRLGQIISRKQVHRRVDCHIATAYGGTWGMSWAELFPIFCENFVVGNNVDWLGHKESKSHFLTTERNRKNYSDDFVGALLIRKIENEKGFDGVWELLMTKRTKEEEEYFAILEKLTGITKANYNDEVYKLIQEEMGNFNM